MTELKELVLASGNAGKLLEFQTLLAETGIRVHAQSEFSVPEVAETGLTFVENALIKARNAARATGLPALADDSGIEVDCLQGQPGIYSARYAGADANDQQNNAKLIAKMAAIPEPQRTARYWCVLVLMRNADDPIPLICQASWAGRILHQPRGEGGFGYDPLFWLEALGCTAAELDKDHKNAISHRGQAMSQLLGKLNQDTQWRS